MEIGLLGPVEVRDGGRALDCGPPQQRHVLAVLAASVGEPVTAEALIDRVWDDAPEGARRTLHVYVARLRGLLSGAVVRRSGGYVLDVDPACVDVHRLLSWRAGSVQDPVALWRGEPLAGLPGKWAARTREAWRREYVDAVLSWAEAELGSGDPTALVATLTKIAADCPLHEPLAAMLIRALHAEGRDAEARECYERIRLRLADELGIDPGEELQRAYDVVRRTVPVPAQLPADPYGFAGRAEALAALDERLSRTSTMVVSALSGTAGVGKTALAVHWAHRVAGEFPDGQLYVNLRGFDPAGQVMTAAETVRGFLDALGVAPERLPQQLDAQLELYRSLVADERILVVLDNARDVEQVRPLLPGTPTVLTVVTSRNRLVDLDAEPLLLDVLSTVEARQLLGRRLGIERVEAESDAVERIVVACARLPLALAVVAARAQVSRRPLAELADELETAGTRLDSLDTGDPATRVRAVFSWSYEALSDGAARLFRLLGLHPGPDISVPAAGSLAATGEAGALLVELAQANLVDEHVAGRYTFHDLLRAYAAELVQHVDPESDRQAAIGRMLDHYAYSACTAAVCVQPTRDPLVLQPAGPGVSPERPADARQGLDWFMVEHPILVAAVDLAVTHGFDQHAWPLAWALYDFLYRRGHWDQWVHTGTVALDAAVRLGDLEAQDRVHHQLGGVYNGLLRFDEAYPHLMRALELRQRSGDVAKQGHSHHRLAFFWGSQDRHADALTHAEQAVECFREAGHQAGLASALNTVGWHQAKLGRYAEALTSCGQALGLLEAVNDQYGLALTWDSLGYAHQELGNFAESLACYQRALEVHERLSDRYVVTRVHDHLGDLHRLMGNDTAARTAWQKALAMLLDLDHPDADGIRAKLDAG